VKKRNILLNFKERSVRLEKFRERAALRVLRPRDFLWKSTFRKQSGTFRGKWAATEVAAASYERRKELQRVMKTKQNVRLHIQDISRVLSVLLFTNLLTISE